MTRTIPRVWVLTNAPSPYQVELMAAVHASGEVEPHVRFMRVPDGSIPQDVAASGLSYRELRSAAPRSWGDEFRLHPEALWEAAFGDYDVYILSGLYTSVTFLACAAILHRGAGPGPSGWSVPARKSTDGRKDSSAPSPFSMLSAAPSSGFSTTPGA